MPISQSVRRRSRLVGKSIDGTSINPASSKRGRNKGVASLENADVEAKISELLKGSPDGLAGSKIAESIHATNWTYWSYSPIYQRVTKILNADQQLSEDTRKFREQVELRNTK